MNTLSTKKHETCKGVFLPGAPNNLESMDISESLLEDLILRRLFTVGTSSLKSLCSSLKLSFPIAQTLFQQLRQKQLLEVTGMNGHDYTFTLTEAGREQASTRFKKSHYAGAAPVSVKSYYAAVRAQASKVRLNRSLLKKTLSDLVLTSRFLDELGPALISQTSLFLYGPTGSGKTSVAERLRRIYTDVVLIPYAVEFDGQVIVLYDPSVHERLETHETRVDPRWVLCRRPCIKVGGELDPNMLELQLDESSGIYAAPLQMKANNGMLIIDDFGRQLISPRYLLNRWIVPLDRRVDYLSLRYGVKFQIPFEMIVVFATNLNPSELADEAFLRRIQNKVFVEPVQPLVFDEIFRRVVAHTKLSMEPGTTELFRELCLASGGGVLRACYPVDIINILGSMSLYDESPAEVNKTNLERAVALYFTKTMFTGQLERKTGVGLGLEAPHGQGACEVDSFAK
jgi:hypothetical protein